MKANFTLKEGCNRTHLVKARAQKPWDLLDESVRGEEGIILLGQAFHLLLVLVELLQVVGGHEVDAFGLWPLPHRNAADLPTDKP